MRPETGAAVEEIGGGYATFAGAGSPVTQAIGLGLNGTVSVEEFARLEAFYSARSEPVRVETCPLADPSLFEHFAKNGYRVMEFTNVMARPVGEGAVVANTEGIQIRRAEAGEVDLWVSTTATSFADGKMPGSEILEIMKGFALADGVEAYLATVDGRVAGGGTLTLRDGVAGFFGAGTLPEFRRRGVQTALLNARLERARESGCDIAVCLAAPGSSSQRNVVRRGFQVLYTRVKFEK